MKLTPEQEVIISSKENLVINAVAGSGKTTTLIAYAKSRPAQANILYMAFNKSVKMEAEQRFKNEGLHNVKVETAHSLAYKSTVFKYGYEVNSNGYSASEIVQMLNISSSGDRHSEYVLANHVLKFAAYFCNSDAQKVSDLDYSLLIKDEKAREFVLEFYASLLQYTRVFLAKMYKAEIAITHDFYLKRFQLDQPRLRYDYILFDEGQDASPAMLHVFLRQNATKVIVGDAHQQIYGWRHAINSLNQVEFKQFDLSTSFRFSAAIADLAEKVVARKELIDEPAQIKIIGKGTHTQLTTKATIARTNLGLLLKAIEYVSEKKAVKKIYFEGNINSYTYADNGTSLYDVLNLSLGKRARIKDSVIQQMKDLDDLEEYINKTDEKQLGMLLEIVKEYGEEIPKRINELKEMHVDNDDRNSAQMIFSTVHRSKGMEYDSVQLVNDFLTENKLKELATEQQIEHDTGRLAEEINLLYVAITRTKSRLIIPESLMPENWKKQSDITVLTEEQSGPKVEIFSEYNSIGKSTSNLVDLARQAAHGQKAYTIESVRQTHKQAYAKWTSELDNELIQLQESGMHVKDLAKHFGRTRGAISSRLKKLSEDIEW